MKDTTRIGAVTVSAVQFALLKKGYNVLVPVNEGLRYDLVAEIEGQFHRVQCKTGILKPGFIEFRNYTVRRGGLNIEYGDTIDYFGVYCPQNEKVYLLPQVECKSKITRLRLIPPLNNTKLRTRWAEKYEVA